MALADFYDLHTGPLNRPEQRLHVLRDPFIGAIGSMIRPVNDTPTGVPVADFDRCMGNDIAVVTLLGDPAVGGMSGTLQVFFQDPHAPNHFPMHPQQTYLLGDNVWGLAVATGEFNADGVADLVVAYYDIDIGGGFLRVYLCDPVTNVFLPQTPVRIDAPSGNDMPTSMCVADFEGDCLHDVAVMTLSGRAYVAQGDSSAAGLLATPLQVRPNDVVGPFGIAARDLTWDGRPELITGNDLGPTRISLLHNVWPNGTPGSDPYFDADTQLLLSPDPADPQPHAVAVGTFKGAQGPFVAAADTANQRVVVFTRTDFENPPYIASQYRVEAGAVSIAAGDLDANGDDDLVVANQFSNSLSVFLHSRAGGGRFEGVAIQSLSAPPQAVGVVDVDGDGTGDTVVVGGTAQNSYPWVISSCARTTLDPCVKGDMNNDGRIDGTDIQLFVNVIIVPTGASEIMRCRADMNGDGGVDETDRDLLVCALLQNHGPCCSLATLTGGGGDGSGAPSTPSTPADGGNERPPPRTPEQRLSDWDVANPRSAYPSLSDREYARMRTALAVRVGADDPMVMAAFDEYFTWWADNPRRHHSELTDEEYNQLCLRKLSDLGLYGETL